MHLMWWSWLKLNEFIIKVIKISFHSNIKLQNWDIILSHLLKRQSFVGRLMWSLEIMKGFSLFWIIYLESKYFMSYPNNFLCFLLSRSGLVLLGPTESLLKGLRLCARAKALYNWLSVFASEVFVILAEYVTKIIFHKAFKPLDIISQISHNHIWNEISLTMS